MGKFYDHLTDDLRTFIGEQQLFFVATAPLAPEGHVNLSPKGLDCFRVLSPKRVAYLDITGSGNETSAHLLENGRITFMFCAFAGSPLILRLYGQGRAVLPGAPGWDDLAPHFTLYPGARQIIAAEIDLVQTSCGFGVPLYDYRGQRDAMVKTWERKDPSQYQQDHNRESIDHLPTPLAKLIP